MRLHRRRRNTKVYLRLEYQVFTLWGCNVQTCKGHLRRFTGVQRNFFSFLGGLSLSVCLLCRINSSLLLSSRRAFVIIFYDGKWVKGKAWDLESGSTKKKVIKWKKEVNGINEWKERGKLRERHLCEKLFSFSPSIVLKHIMWYFLLFPGMGNKRKMMIKREKSVKYFSFSCFSLFHFSSPSHVLAPVQSKSLS